MHKKIDNFKYIESTKILVSQELIIDRNNIKNVGEPFEPINEHHFKLSKLVLRDISKSKGVNGNVSAYSLKHIVERYFHDSESISHFYVSVGGVCRAMLELGFDFYLSDNPNDFYPFFNIEQKSIKLIFGE